MSDDLRFATGEVVSPKVHVNDAPKQHAVLRLRWWVYGCKCRSCTAPCCDINRVVGPLEMPDNP
eukprot:1158280-Pelagomonas_calceolata.AAC.2